jgi:hypothetical protein
MADSFARAGMTALAGYLLRSYVAELLEKLDCEIGAMEMRFSRLLLIVTAALPLGACMTASEQQKQAQAIAADDDAACRSAGAKPGTMDYFKCQEGREDQRGMAQAVARTSRPPGM